MSSGPRDPPEEVLPVAIDEGVRKKLSLADIHRRGFGGIVVGGDFLGVAPRPRPRVGCLLVGGGSRACG